MMMLDSVSKTGIGGNLSPNQYQKNQGMPCAADRLAQSHVEDVQTISRKFERTTQELDKERREHDRTRINIMKHRTENIQLEAHSEKVLETMKTQKEDDGRLIESLKSELASSKARVDAADEDAQAAIDLAKEALASKQQVESLLQERLSAIGRERCHVAHAVTNQEKISLRSTGGGAMVDVGPLTQRTVDAGHAVAKRRKNRF
jgi:hypothetical protein